MQRMRSTPRSISAAESDNLIKPNVGLRTMRVTAPDLVTAAVPVLVAPAKRRLDMYALLHELRHEWLVVAPVDVRRGCSAQRFFADLERHAPAEHRQLLARLQALAGRGRIADEHKARHLGDGIFELKTRGGVRVVYFVDKRRIIVCTESSKKPKARQLSWLVRQSRTIRASYLAAQRVGALRIVQEP